MWILEGTCHNPGHDWKDGWKRGEKVLAYSWTLPPPYAAGQHPRLGVLSGSVTAEHFQFERVSIIRAMRLLPTVFCDLREHRKWKQWMKQVALNSHKEKEQG